MAGDLTDQSGLIYVDTMDSHCWSWIPVAHILAILLLSHSVVVYTRYTSTTHSPRTTGSNQATKFDNVFNQVVSVPL